MKTEKAKVVPMSEWGKDHFSTLAYLECRAVDYGGDIGREQMRCDPDIHPQFGHRGTPHDKKYPTILKGGKELYGHDDWSCMEDIEAAGLIKNEGTGFAPIVVFTKKGFALAAKLRRFKAGGGSFSTFDPTK